MKQIMSRSIHLIFLAILFSSCNKTLEELLNKEILLLNYNIGNDSYVTKKYSNILTPDEYGHCYSDDSVFYFKLFGTILEGIDINQYELLYIHPGKPILNKRYPLINLCDINPENLKDGCWLRIIETPYFYERMDTLTLPKEIRKERGIIRTDKSQGYIIFTKIDIEINEDNYISGAIEGKFEIEVEGKNLCYPEMQTHISFTNGTFKSKTYCYNKRLSQFDISPSNIIKSICIYK